MNNLIQIEIKRIIDSEKSSLENYIKKGNPNQNYVDITNKKIGSLQSIYDDLANKRHLEFWQQTEVEIDRLIKQDPEIGIILVPIKVNLKKCAIAYLNERYLC